MSEQLGLAGLTLRLATRPAGRLFAQLLLLALIAFALSGALLLGQVVGQETTRAAGRLGADIMIVPQGTGGNDAAKLLGGVPVAAGLPKGIEARLATMAGVSRIAPQYVFSAAADPCCEMGNVLLVGFDPARDLTILPWLRPADALADNEGQLLAGSRVMKAAGAELRFFGHALTLKARLEKSGVATFDTALFIPLQALAAMERTAQRNGQQLPVAWGKPSLLLLRLEPAFDPQQLALALEQQNPGIKALPLTATARNDRFLLEDLAGGGRPLAAAAWFLSLLAGGAWLFTSFRSRRPSLGLLQAFGCGKGLLALSCALETFSLALAGMAAGGLAAFVALSLSGAYLAMATGLPLLAEGLSRAAATISWSIPAFAGAMGIEAALIVLLLLRQEPADLLRGNR